MPSGDLTYEIDGGGRWANVNSSMSNWPRKDFKDLHRGAYLVGDGQILWLTFATLATLAAGLRPKANTQWPLSGKLATECHKFSNDSEALPHFPRCTAKLLASYFNSLSQLVARPSFLVRFICGPLGRWHSEHILELGLGWNVIRSTCA